MDKLKLAAYWAASCGGCDVSILDIDEKILDLAAAADIVFWPIAVDAKYADVEAMEDGFIDVTLFNGAIRNSEQEHLAHLLRAKSKVLVAFGACACFGGIPGLANEHNREAIFQWAYCDSPSTNCAEVMPQTRWEAPEGELTLPEFYNRVSSLGQVVPVDYYLPGCPPTADLVWTAAQAIVSGELPPPGSTIAGEKTLCDECPRTRSEEKAVRRFRRLWEFVPDTEQCLLEQGIICSGPATRAGCGAKCPGVNIPCRGCFGPSGAVIDQGAKMLAAVSAVIDSEDPEEIERITAQIDDPLGTFYRFVLPTSLLRRARL